MKAVAIFPVTFTRVEDLGGEYVAMNLTEFNWPRSVGLIVTTTAFQATQIFRKNSC